MTQTSNEFLTRATATKYGKRDKEHGFGCFPERHGASNGSAWAMWYRAGWNETTVPNLKTLYQNQHPGDAIGETIKSDATLAGLWNCLEAGTDPYEYFGVGDSIVRERLFSILAERRTVDYNVVYELWLQNSKY